MRANPQPPVRETRPDEGEKAGVRVSIQFYSYFKDLTGCAQTTEALPKGSTIGDLLTRLHAHFPKLAAMKNSTLVAVGVEYQRRDFVLKDGDEVSLFPPVQGG